MMRNNIAIWLWMCLTIFTCRVLAQLLVLLFDIPFLPSFEAWYSGVISYQILLLIQLLIISLMAIYTFRISKNRLEQRPTVGRVIQFIAVIYFSVMFIRLIISLAGLSELLWFNRPIPSFFHLVLALYLFLIGRYHASSSGQQEAW